MNYKKQALNKAGLPPGSLIHVGKRIKGDIKISITEYNSSEHFEIDSSTIEKTISLEDNSKISWINIDGLHNTEAIGKIGTHFDIHGLLIEDILNTNHRPKAVELDETSSC